MISNYNARLITVLLFLCIHFSTDAQRKKDINNLHQIFEESSVFQEIFTGFALYNPEQHIWIYQREADKYYTPASNTKILTLYSSLVLLGDSIPSLFYQETDSTFLFWGTGDPSFLYANLPDDNSTIQFLQQQKKPLYYSDHNFKEERFGAGWSWDDYNYIYQSERSAFPIYGNYVTFKHAKDSVGFKAIPSYFQDKVTLDVNMDNRRPRFRRSLDSNQFTCNSNALMGRDYERYVPFRQSNPLFLELLSDTLKRKIELQKQPINASDIHEFYSDMPADSVYQLMMQDSDNFVAEQLLLTASSQAFGIQNTQQIIDYVKEYHLSDLTKEVVWVDGSGLSRYNLFTPRSVVQVLDKIYRLLPEERLLNIFPAGGVSGTIEKWYAPEKGAAPYVFAKTGTLSNKHCLSGYIKTKSGKTLIFSFMNNNYIKSSTPVKKEMQKVLEFIRDNY